MRPPVLDLSLDDETLRPACVEGLDTMSPMFAIVNHGCESKLRDLAASMRTQIAKGPTTTCAQRAHDIDGELAPVGQSVRECLRGVCLRVLGIVLGDRAVEASLADRGLDLQGRLCMREYPANPAAMAAAASSNGVTHDGCRSQAPRLGAHCDNTLLTLLWSDGPGLEVLDPARADGWTRDQVLQYGLPTMGEVSEIAELRSDQWALVDLEWANHPLLLTIGSAWLSNELVSSVCPARCAVLHRVVLSPERARHSLPFLVDLVPLAATGEPGEAQKSRAP